MARDPDRRNTARLVVIAIFVIVLIALILDNTNKVNVGFVVTDVDVALWVLVLVSALLGAGVGALLRRRG
jgi:uncharacterized integral membrane protein